MKKLKSVVLRPFSFALLALAGVLTMGTIGYHHFGEGWNASFYRSLVAISLSGFDTAPDTNTERIFTICMILLGVAIFLYVAGAIAEAIARGVVTGAWQERRRRLTIEAMRNHFIICGYGRVGRRAAREFRESDEPYVIVDFHADALEAARKNGDLLVEGSGTEDVNLVAAG
ncbi:MAG TPA: NAD-binding protein, partial [Acidimicrobiales bacterium]